MRGLIVWVLCFFYSTFLLGSFPLPPVPGRPFSEENFGTSRFPIYSGLSERISHLGAENSIWVAWLLLLVIFGIWMFARHSRTLYKRHGGFPIFSFLCLLVSSLVMADFSREIGVISISAYGQARAEWIFHGGELIYPKWPTEELKIALQTQVTTEIDSALNSVVKPRLEKIPTFESVYEPCRLEYQKLIAAAGPLSTAPGYSFPCRLMEEVISRFGKADLKNSQECFYGPAVKIIHALDRQKIRCDLASLRGENRKDVVCKGFWNEFGMNAFSFCK